MLRTLFLVLFIVYLMCLVILCFSDILPKSIWWLTNAISMGPLYVLAFPLLITLASVFVLPWKRMLLIGNLLSIIMLVYICGFVFHPNMGDDDFKSLLELRIMTANMGNGGQTNKLLKLMKEQSIDLVAIQESSASCNGFLQQMPTINCECSTRICLLGRYPFKLVDAKARKFLKDWGVFIAQYEVILSTRVIDFIVVHLQTPRDGLESMKHNPIAGIPFMKKVTEHQNIESWVSSNWAAKGKNVIVAGDFNMTMISPLYKANWYWLGNVFQEVGNGFGYTKYTKLYGARIDHVLFNNLHWTPLKAWVEDSLGGDHKPVIAVIKPK